MCVLGEIKSLIHLAGMAITNHSWCPTTTKLTADDDEVAALNLQLAFHAQNKGLLTHQISRTNRASD